MIDPAPWSMEEPFNFYINELKPLIIEYGTQKIDGIHGLNTHTNAVVFRGIDYALSLRKDPKPVIFACAFHDMARVNDCEDYEHGKNAIPMAKKVLDKFPDLFDKQTRFNIYRAVIEHTQKKPSVAPDYIAACLWDADRTRMSWKYGFKPEFFNTERGKYVAQHWKQYIDYQKSLFPHIKWSKEY